MHTDDEHGIDARPRDLVVEAERCHSPIVNRRAVVSPSQWKRTLKSL